MGKSRYSKAIKGEYDRKRDEYDRKNLNLFKPKKESEYNSTHYNNNNIDHGESFLSQLLSFIGSIF